MRSENQSEWKRLFQIFVIIMLIASGLGVFVYYMPTGRSASPYDVSLTVDSASKEVNAGGQTNYAFTITNEGNNGDRYTVNSTVSASPTGWTVTLSKTTTANIASGGTDTFTVSVRAPTGANISSYCYATIKVTSQNDALNSSQSVLISTLIKRTYGVSISSPGIQSIDPGDSIAYSFNVKNEGNDQDGYQLDATTIPSGWSASVDFDTGKINSGATKAASMTIQSPTSALTGSYQFVVTAQSITDNTTSTTKTITVNVNQTYEVTLQSEGVKQVDITTETVVTFNVQLTNLGNGEDQFNLEYYIPPQYVTSGWGADLSTTTTSKVQADEDVNVTLTVYPPAKSLRPAVNSKGEFYINATSVGDNTITRSVKVSCVVKPFYDVRILNTGASLQTVDPDGSTTFTFNVTNTGNDQDDLEFELIVPDGFQDSYVEPSSITLNANDYQLITVTVDPDEDVVKAKSYRFTLYANSSQGPSSSSPFSVSINKKYGAFLDAPSGAIIAQGQPGHTYTIPVRLQNKGNGRDSFNLAVMGESQSVETEWSPLLSAATTPLMESDDYYTYNLTVSAPSNATQGTYRFQVNASSQNSAVFKTIWLSVRIPQLYSVDISANKESVKGNYSPATGSPEVVYFDLDIYNRGSGEDDSVSVRVQQAPADFAGKYSIYFTTNDKSKITIQNGDSEGARLEIEMPTTGSGINSGTFFFMVETTSDNGTITDTSDDKTAMINLSLVLRPLHSVRILTSINTSKVKIGNNVSFTAVIQNRGTTSDYYQVDIEFPTDYLPDVTFSKSKYFTRILAPLEQDIVYINGTIQEGTDPDWGSVWVKVIASHSVDETINNEKFFTAIFQDDFSADISTTDNFEQAYPGDDAWFNLSITNRGTRSSDTFEIEVEDALDFDNIVITPSIITMSSNQRTLVSINVTVPDITDKIIETGVYNLIFKVTSSGETAQKTDDIIVGNITLKIKVMPVYKVQFVIPEGSKTADPGDRLSNIKLNITNKGNEPATISVKLSSTTNRNWVSISPSTVSDLPPNAATDMIATINVPTNALAGKVTFTFEATVTSDPSTTQASALEGFDVDVNEEFEPELTVPSGTTTKEAEPGETKTFTVKLKNIGNTIDGFDIEVASTKSDWIDFGFEGSLVTNPQTSIDDMNVEGAKNIWVTILVDISASAGEVTFTLKATSKGDDAQTDTMALKIDVLPNRDVELVTSEEKKEMIPDVDEKNTEVDFEVQVRNKGEATDTFKIQVLKSSMVKPAGVDQATWDAMGTSGQFSDQPDWVILSKKVTGSIAKGQSETITVTLRVSDNSYDPADIVSYIWAYSEGDTAPENKYSEPLKLTVTIKKAYGAEIGGYDLGKTSVDASDPTLVNAFFTVEITNTGTSEDDFQLDTKEDLPFEIEFLYPVSGNNPSGGNIISDVGGGDTEHFQIQVVLDADTLTGKYSFELRWISRGEGGGFSVVDGDYATEWKEFTIDVDQVYGVDVEADKEEIKGDVGDDIVFDLKLINLGNDDDTFRLEIVERETDDWATLSNSKLSLDAKGRTNDEKTFTLTVRIPDDNEDALAGIYTFELNIVRDASTRAEQDKATISITLTVEVKESYDHELETEDDTEEAKPGEMISYRFKIENRANIQDTFYLDVKGSKDDWAELQAYEVTLGPMGADNEAWLWLNITIPDLEEVNDPDEIEADTYDFTIEVESKGDRDAAPVTLDFEVDVEQEFDATISEIVDGGELGSYNNWDVNDEDDLEIEVTIQNNGNKDDTFYIKKPSAPTGWEISVSSTHVPVSMGDEKTITITISFFPTDGFVFGSQSLKFEVIPDDGSTQGKKDKEIFNVYINAEVPELVLRDNSLIIPSSPTANVVNEVTVTVYNTGTGNAEDVEVVLYDGTKSYRTDKMNIPKDGKANFTFEWKPGTGDHKLVAKVNEGDLLIEQDTDNNEVEKKKSISVFDIGELIGNVWVIGILIAILLIIIFVVIFLAVNKNREVKELEEIIAKMKAGGGPGGPRKVIKEAGGAPVASSGAVGLPSAPGKLAPVPAPGGEAKAAKKENVKVQCPKCMTQQVVSINQRPAEIPCKECGVTLVIPEKKK